MKNVSAPALIVFAFALADPLLGQTALRHPWEWTSAERIHKRTDPTIVRSLTVPAEKAGFRMEAFTTNKDVIRLEGRTHPELFLPIELFRNVLSGLGSADPKGERALRDAYSPVTSRLDLGPAFWDELRAIGGDYLKRNMRIRELNGRLGGMRPDRRARCPEGLEHDALAARQCATLATALDMARARFGTERFDRFLYEAVAPNMVVVLASAESTDALEAWERGCR